MCPIKSGDLFNLIVFFCFLILHSSIHYATKDLIAIFNARILPMINIYINSS